MGGKPRNKKSSDSPKMATVAERVLSTSDGAKVTVRLSQTALATKASWTCEVFRKGWPTHSIRDSEPDALDSLQCVLMQLSRALQELDEPVAFLPSLPSATGFERLYNDADMDQLLAQRMNQQLRENEHMVDAITPLPGGVLQGLAKELEDVELLRQRIRIRVVALAEEGQCVSTLFGDTPALQVDTLSNSSCAQPPMVTATFLRRDSDVPVCLELWAPEQAKGTATNSWSCEYLITGLDSRIHAKTKALDSMGALLSALESIHADFTQSELVLNYLYSDGSWDSDSELGVTGFEPCSGPPEERALLKHITEVEILQNKLLFHGVRETPRKEMRVYEEQLLQSLRKAQQVRFVANRKSIDLGKRISRSSTALTRLEAAEIDLESTLNMTRTICLGSALDADLRVRLFDLLRELGGIWDEATLTKDGGLDQQVEVNFEEKRLVVEAERSAGLRITGRGSVVGSIQTLLRMRRFTASV